MDDKLIFQVFFKYFFDTFKCFQDFRIFRYIFEVCLYFKKSDLYIYYYINNFIYYYNYINNYVCIISNFNNNSFLFKYKNKDKKVFEVFSKILK
jgi:hypothetical protein